jgi:hypothetical protein
MYIIDTSKQETNRRNKMKKMSSTGKYGPDAKTLKVIGAMLLKEINTEKNEIEDIDIEGWKWEGQQDKKKGRDMWNFKHLRKENQKAYRDGYYG